VSVLGNVAERNVDTSTSTVKQSGLHSSENLKMDRIHRSTVVNKPKKDQERDVDRSRNMGLSKIVNLVPRDAVATSMKPLKAEAINRRPEECRYESDYSDGVTLDVSVADVSGLTTPRSKGGNSCQSASRSSSKLSVVADTMEAEAKQSEASSSQSSEDAAPLLAHALGLGRTSDNASVF